MIYLSTTSTKYILLSLFLFVAGFLFYFVNEVKKIERTYDEIVRQNLEE